MNLSTIDLTIISVFIGITLLIAWYARSTASKGLEGFFLGGKNMPWYLAGVSMVATTFAADTPLAVTELVAENGISGNWVWWNFLFGGMFTAIFYAQLWRRSGVVTETEFITLRYSGKAAKWLKRFKAGYLGLIMNAIILAWVNLAFMSLIEVFFGIPASDQLLYAGAAMLIVALYSAVSGLLGIALTDAFQFIIALGGCIVLAILVVNSDAIGGIDGLKSKLPAGSLNVLPSLSQSSSSVGLQMSMASFIAFAGMIWWTSWYPGAEPGGGGYIAQRMLSTKNEKHSFLATTFFQFAHYGLRPWPWIIVGLASIVLYPELEVKRLGYVYAMRDFLPDGLKGLLLVAFLGAYMSTVSTHLNWGASYIMNDVIDGHKLPRNKLVSISRILTFIIVALAMIITTQINSIKGVWEFIMECGAGLGLLLMLRWFWFRINAWAEITATITPFIVYAFQKFYLVKFFPILGKGMSEDPTSFFITVGVTTLAWVLVTLLTSSNDPEHMKRYSDKIFPQGIDHWKIKLPYYLLAWIGGIGSIYSFLFLTGKVLFKEFDQAVYLTGGLIFGLALFYIGAKKAKLL